MGYVAGHKQGERLYRKAEKILEDICLNLYHELKKRVEKGEDYADVVDKPLRGAIK
jgi:hypothetical protein